MREPERDEVADQSPEPDDLAEAERLFEEAAAGGHPDRTVEAALRLADEYYYLERAAEGLALVTAIRGALGRRLGDADLGELEAKIASMLLFGQRKAQESIPWFESAAAAFDSAGLEFRSAGVRYNLGVASTVTGNYAGAVSWFAEAARLFAGQGEELDACDCTIGAAVALAAAGNLSVAEAEVSGAQEDAARLGQPQRPARFLVGMAKYAEWAGAVDAVYWAFDRAAAITRAPAESALAAATPDEGPLAAHLEALREAGEFALRRGDPARAEELADIIEAVGTARADSEVQSDSWTLRAQALMWRGLWQQAADAARRAHDLDPDPVTEAQSLNALGMVDLRSGRLVQAEERFSRAVAIAEEAGLESYAVALRSDLAVTWLRGGQGWRAIPVFERLAEAAPTPSIRGLAHLNLAAAMGQGNPDAGPHLEAAHSLLGLRDANGLLAAAQLASHLADREDSADRARALLEEVIAAADARGVVTTTDVWLLLAGAAESVAPHRLEAVLDRGEETAKAGGDAATLAQVRFWRASLLRDRGKLRRSRKKLREALNGLPEGYLMMRVVLEMSLAEVLDRLAARRGTPNRRQKRLVSDAVDLAVPALLVAETLVRSNPRQRLRLHHISFLQEDWLRMSTWAVVSDNDNLGELAELVEYFQATGRPVPSSASASPAARALRSIVEDAAVADAMADRAVGDRSRGQAAVLSAAFIDVLDEDDETPLAPVPRVRMPSGRIALERYARLAVERYGVQPFGETVIAIVDATARDET